MKTTTAPTAVPYREVTDRNGRTYRIGETDRDIMNRPRWAMVLCPWIGMMGISSSEYAFTSAEDTLHTAHAWSSGHIFWLMGVWVFFQAAVAFPAGQLRESGRLPARNAMMLGAAGTLIGYVSLAYAPNVMLAYLGFGAFSGTGAGMVYATCVNMVGKWYPERKGGKTGLVNGGFAYGSVPFVFLFTSYMDLSNYEGVLVFVGVICCVTVASAGWFFRDPPKNWWPPHADPLKKSDDPRIVRALEKNPPAVRQFTPREASRTPVLWMMWFCLLCTAGINIFGIAMQVPFGKDMGFAGGIVATAMSLKAIVNGTGRGVIGWISDRYGRRNTLIIVCVVLGSAQFGVLASGTMGNMPFFLFCSMVSGFGGGAIFPLFAAMTADFFGENHNAANYGMVYSSKLISGLLGSGMGAVVVSAWDYEGAFALAGGIGIASAFLAVFLRQPGRPSARKIEPNPYPISREAM
ncbi:MULTISPECIES: OFA family MFS transporter [unclassified Streptomyces]|uniref:OFA family MFS transporter n=1 Tax=unclassified Streptomyces TaxID=2593676 RepID=UPI002DD91161|nr:MULTISPECIES: OFA family MFS transporter [unclassified Streptomyces]WSA96340.1 OFA family MFS transporter [Streptomyces sp. NBC_01795]WSB80754.1 OFA family MFS transporter [Streptomyces sp. NBC_01775]WSS11037.1 OFA family MFS transporter [Streptomyces sp. NBC_01186]WSS39745.1 OFA family MFS transporter [Streptomyces sp. NBC_01187]